MQAKEILRRIETRDLYHLSGKVRIPKVYRGSLIAEEDESKSEEDESKSEEDKSKSEEGKSKGKDKLWRALEAMSKQPEGESINEFLTPEKQQTIEKKHLWVPVSAC